MAARLLVVVLVATLVPLFVAASGAQARTRCGSSLPLRTVVDTADLIFVGTRVGGGEATERVDIPGTRAQELVSIQVHRFRAESYLKGTGRRDVLVRGGDFRGSGRYLVMAVHHDDDLLAFCATGSMILASDERLAQIRSIVPPQSEMPLQPLAGAPPPSLPVWETVVGGLGAVTLAAGLLALRWRSGA